MVWYTVLHYGLALPELYFLSKLILAKVAVEERRFLFVKRSKTYENAL